MSHIAHLLRGDVRHFRWPIAIWILLVAADTVLTGVLPGIGDGRTSVRLAMILGLLWFARQLGILLIVPLIIQAHPAVGTDAFWMTRPIPPLSLAAAKTLLIAMLLLAVPAIAEIVLMLSIGVPAREAILVAIEDSMGAALWLAVLGAGAAVTLNLPRFALLGGVVFLSIVVTVTISLMRARYDAGEYTAELVVAGSGQPILPAVEDPTEGMVFLLGATAAGLAVIALQYRTRLRRVSLPVGIGCVAVLAFVLPYWPFPLLRVRSALPPWAYDTRGAQLRVDSPVIEVMSPEGWSVEGVPTVRRGMSRVMISGLAPGWLSQAQLRRASLTLANGSTLVSARSNQSALPIDPALENPEQVVARQVLGVGHVTMPSGYAPDQGATVLAMPASDIDRVLPATAVYRGEFVVLLTHWELAAVLPLRPGATFHDGTYRLVVDGVNTAPGTQIGIRAREWRATSAFDRKPRITYAFYVRNAQHTDALAGYESDAFGGAGTLPFGVPFGISFSAESQRFYTRAVHVFFPLRYGQPAEVVRWEPDWNASAELLVVRRTEAGAVARTLEIPHASLAQRPNR
jgi:hypothetical protein